MRRYWRKVEGDPFGRTKKIDEKTSEEPEHISMVGRDQIFVDVFNISHVGRLLGGLEGWKWERTLRSRPNEEPFVITLLAPARMWDSFVKFTKHLVVDSLLRNLLPMGQECLVPVIVELGL